MSDQVVYTVQLIDISDIYSNDVTGEWIFADEALADAQVEVLEALLASAPGDKAHPDHLINKYPTTISTATVPAVLRHQVVAAPNVVALGHGPGLITWPVFGDEATSLTPCAQVPHEGDTYVEFEGTDPDAVMAAVTAAIATWPRPKPVAPRGPKTPRCR